MVHAYLSPFTSYLPQCAGLYYKNVNILIIAGTFIGSMVVRGERKPFWGVGSQPYYSAPLFQAYGMYWCLSPLRVAMKARQSADHEDENFYTTGDG